MRRSAEKSAEKLHGHTTHQLTTYNMVHIMHYILYIYFFKTVAYMQQVELCYGMLCIFTSRNTETLLLQIYLFITSNSNIYKNWLQLFKSYIVMYILHKIM
jgi:hypothetical protein